MHTLLKRVKNTSFYKKCRHAKRMMIHGIPLKLCPEWLIKKNYQSIFGVALDLKNPRTIDDKVNWIKLHVNDPLISKCTDKYAVRDYVKQCGYEAYLNEIYDVFQKAENIDNLPNSFVLKCTHGCGYNIICKNKAELDIAKTIKTLNQWMKEKYYLVNIEPHYKFIPPKIICERFIEDALHNDEALIDFKIHCFNGKPVFTSLIARENGKVKIKDFDNDWHELENIAIYEQSKFHTDIQKPKCWDLMLEMAEQLSKPFCVVRVDFYIENDKPIFGELTFTPTGGRYRQFYKESDLITLGDLITLPDHILK